MAEPSVGGELPHHAPLCYFFALLVITFQFFQVFMQSTHVSGSPGLWSLTTRARPLFGRLGRFCFLDGT